MGLLLAIGPRIWWAYTMNLFSTKVISSLLTDGWSRLLHQICFEILKVFSNRVIIQDSFVKFPLNTLTIFLKRNSMYY